MLPRFWRFICQCRRFLAVSRDRLIGFRVHPLDVVELAHCACLGLKGVNRGVFPSGKSYPTLPDDRFCAAAVEMRLPLTVHVAFDRLRPRARGRPRDAQETGPEKDRRLGLPAIPDP